MFFTYFFQNIFPKKDFFNKTILCSIVTKTLISLFGQERVYNSAAPFNDFCINHDNY